MFAAGNLTDANAFPGIGRLTAGQMEVLRSVGSGSHLLHAGDGLMDGLSHVVYVLGGEAAHIDTTTGH